MCGVFEQWCGARTVPAYFDGHAADMLCATAWFSLISFVRDSVEPRGKISMLPISL